MGSPSEATLFRRELVEVHRKYGAEIMSMCGDNRQLASRLSEGAAERDGPKITCRIQEAALAAAAGNDAWLSEGCKKTEDDTVSMRALLRRHENPNSPASSRTICHRERGKLRAEIGSYNEGATAGGSTATGMRGNRP